MNLENKVVLVTGSSLGIGRETALQFAQRRANVAVTYYKDKKEGEKVFQECKKYGNALLLRFDVANNNSIDDVVNEIIKKYNRIDILVNNAGTIYWKELINQSYKEIEEQIAVNLLGLIKLTRAFLPYWNFQAA